MGIAASLFYSTSDTENCLDWRVRPSDEQYDAQKERRNDLADYLRDDLAERSDCSIASWLQGSYKFGTQVRPAGPEQEFDIDLGVYFRWSGEPEDGDHDASDLKKMVQASLKDYSSNDDNDAASVGEPRAKCSRVHFGDGFHIDVPAYHLDGTRDAVRSRPRKTNGKIATLRRSIIGGRTPRVTPIGPAVDAWSVISRCGQRFVSKKRLDHRQFC